MTLLSPPTGETERPTCICGDNGNFTLDGGFRTAIPEHHEYLARFLQDRTQERDRLKAALKQIAETDTVGSVYRAWARRALSESGGKGK